MILATKTVTIGNLDALPGGTHDDAVAGIFRAFADISALCGLSFKVISGAADINIVAGVTFDGEFVYGALWRSWDKTLVIATDDKRGYSAQRTFQVVRHELWHACVTPAHNDANPQSPANSNGGSGSWAPEDIVQWQRLYGPPKAPTKMTRLEVAKAILSSPEARRQQINAWYLAYLFRPCDEGSYPWWLGIWEREGPLAVQAGILASDAAWTLTHSAKGPWLDHAYRTALHRAPTADDVNYWSGNMQ